MPRSIGDASRGWITDGEQADRFDVLGKLEGFCHLPGIKGSNPHRTDPKLPCLQLPFFGEFIKGNAILFNESRNSKP